MTANEADGDGDAAQLGEVVVGVVLTEAGEAEGRVRLRVEGLGHLIAREAQQVGLLGGDFDAQVDDVERVGGTALLDELVRLSPTRDRQHSATTFDGTLGKHFSTTTLDNILRGWTPDDNTRNPRYHPSELG